MAGWTVTFDADFTIGEIWNAVIVSHVDSTYVLRNAAWNGDLAGNAQTDFGFVATGTGGLRGLVVQDTPTVDSAVFRATQCWTGDFLGEVTVQKDASALRGWTVAFGSAFEISDIWNAEIVSHTGNHYVVKNASWAGNVAGSGNTTFGFVADGGGNATGLVVHSTAPPPPAAHGQWLQHHRQSDRRFHGPAGAAGRRQLVRDGDRDRSAGRAA